MRSKEELIALSSIGDKENIKGVEIIFDNKYFTSCKFLLKNRNTIKESIPKWKQKDFSKHIYSSNEEKLDNHIDRFLDREGYIGRNTILEDYYGK